MKATGMVRRLDELGRICLPKELRNTMGIKNHTPLEIFVDEDAIVIKKYESGQVCRCCGARKNLTTVYDLHMCPKCIDLFNDAKKTLQIK